MITNHESGAVQCAPDFIPVLQRIGQEALCTSRTLFSSGFPDFEGGSVLKLGFNNERHNIITGRDSKQLLGYLGYSALDQQLGQTTGEAHDRDQLGGRGVDERRSAEWIEAQLYNAGLSRRRARRSRLAIEGTEPLFSPIEPGVIIDQKVNQLEFESLEDEVWAKAISCGDFSEFYTPMSPLLSRGLYVQRQGLHATETPTLNDLPEFLGGQVRLLNSYTYPLKEAETVFATHKRQVCDYAEFVYDQSVRNGIESWAKLHDWDMRFMNNPDINLARLN